MKEKSKKPEKPAIAIYHASTKPIARSAGRSAVAAAAYRAGEKIVDERTGLEHDYIRKGGVVSTEIVLPDGSSVERNALWNAAERAEKRKDARTAREWIVALPDELNEHQRAALARDFGVQLAERYGVAVDIAIHRPDRQGDHRNHHAHILATTRQASRNPSGQIVLGNKSDIELSDGDRRQRGYGPARDEVLTLRKLWEHAANQALEQAGIAERIDARSLKAQGIDREATQHLGPAANDMERRGIQTDRGDGNRQARSHNRERAALAAEIIDLQAERERREIEQENRAVQAQGIERDGPAVSAFRFNLRAQEEARRASERKEAERRAAEAAEQERARVERQKIAALPWREQEKIYETKIDRLAHERYARLQVIENRAHQRYKRRDKPFYDANWRRIKTESNAPKGILAPFRRANYEKELAALQIEEARLKKYWTQAAETSQKLSREVDHGKCRWWAKQEIARREPELTQLIEGQKHPQQEQKRQVIVDRLALERQRPPQTLNNGKRRGR